MYAPEKSLKVFEDRSLLVVEILILLLIESLMRPLRLADAKITSALK